MKKNFITGLVLASFSLICALLLSLVNMVTETKIKAMEEEKINNSIAEVCPYDSNLYMVVEKVNDYPSDVTDADSIVTYVIKSITTEDIYACVYKITKKGFNADIVMLIGVNKNHEITGYTVISQNETKGDITKHDFNVKGKTTLDTFDKLAGSSISSKAVEKCFNTALYVSIYYDMKVEEVK